MDRKFLTRAAVSLMLIWGLTLGCSTDSVLPTGATDVSPGSSGLSIGNAMGVTDEEFNCTNIEKAYVRFSDPGYIQGNVVGMHVKYLGVPSGELKLRIWWDYDNNPTQYKDITIGDSDLLGRDDGLLDIEMLIEHTYDDLNGSEKRKVRVELIRKGETGNCARARTITVKAERKTTEGNSSGAHVLKSGDAVWTTATLRAFSAPTAPPVFYLPPSFAPSPAEFKAFCNALGLSFNMASLPGPIATPFPAVPGPAVFPDVVDSWNPTAFLDMGSNTLGIGPHASVLEIDTRAAQAQIASAISTLSQFELRIYRTRSGVETLIFSASLADLQIQVTDTGPGVSFKFQWNKTFDPGLVEPTDLLRYEIHGMN